MQNSTWKQALNEINEAKLRLQEQINAAIRKFEDETECGITKLQIEYLESTGSTKVMARVVRVDIGI